MSNPAINALLQPMAITEGWLRVLADHAFSPHGKTIASQDRVETMFDVGDEGVRVIRVNGPLSDN